MEQKNKTRSRQTARSKNGKRKHVPTRGKADAPLYQQIAQALKDEIVGGIHPVGSQLPTEDDLCERFSVSRYTVREALRRLREDGLVSSRQGAGTIVVPPRASDSYVHDVNSINDLLAVATGMHMDIQFIKMVPIDEKLAARTGLPRGEEWLAVRGVGYSNDTDPPVCWAEYYIKRNFAAVGRLLHRHSGPVFPLIEDLFGQRIVEVHQEIVATLIPPALADDLKVKAGTAGLEVQRAFRLADGETAQVTISTYPASRFRHAMTMRRVKV